MLYIRQLAWWNVGQKRIDKVGKTEREVKLPSRAKQAEEKEMEIYYPPLAPEAVYLVDYLRSLDFIEPSMGGPIRLSFAEIWSWARLNHIALKPWEVTILRQLSTEFASEVTAAENPQRPAPWVPEVAPVDQKALARRIKDLLRG